VCLKFVRKGHSLVVTKLDRLARSIPDLVKIIGTLEQKGATLNILAMNLDTSSPTGRLLINLVGSIAQFEREIMLERQREGIAKAKGEGKYKGRAATARAKANEVQKLRNAGKGPCEIASQLGISRARGLSQRPQKAVAALPSCRDVQQDDEELTLVTGAEELESRCFGLVASANARTEDALGAHSGHLGRNATTSPSAALITTRTSSATSNPPSARSSENP
jgi:hypothetical protein